MTTGVHLIRPEPRWLVQTRRLFPNRVFAGLTSLACFAVALLFMGLALSGHGAFGVFGLPFIAGTYATARAARMRKQPPTAAEKAERAKQAKPTLAILILLIGMYSWFLTIGIHVFNIFNANGVRQLKYYVTLAIAIAATLYMRGYGRHIIRANFGTGRVGRVEVSAAQCLYVFLFAIGSGLYVAWLAM